MDAYPRFHSFASPRPLLLSVAAVTILLLLGVGLGCEHRPPRLGTYAGHVSGTDAFIAFALADEHVVAYVCDGRQTALWFRGTAHQDTLTFAETDARLLATLHDGTVRGVFIPEDGSAYLFAARPSPGTGFYRAAHTVAGLTYVGGWILLGDGTQRGAVRQGLTVLPGRSVALDPRHPIVVLPNGASMMARPMQAHLADTSPPVTRRASD